jgi:hypothetical protein
MPIILSGALLLLAILNLVLGTGFLVNPENAGSDFGLAVTTLHGSSTLRGDMTSFFYVSALFIGLGAWQRRGSLLLPALALYAITFTGRAINLVIKGSYDGWIAPMAIEGLTVVLLVLAIRSWGLRQAPA